MQTDPAGHDRIFRHAFSEPLVVRQFLQAWLPKEFLALVDWDSLQICKISGINEALAERREDVVWHIQVAGTDVWFYILLEHQSRPEKWMVFRAMEYTMLTWQHDLRENPQAEMLPMVIPVIIYPGPGPWGKVTRLRDLINIPPAIADWAVGFVPDCGLCMVELAKLPLQRLANGRLARAVLGALQGEREGVMSFEKVKELVEEITGEPLKEAASGILRQLWHYLMRHSELQNHEITKIVEDSIPKEEKRYFMTTAERLISEGRQEGQLLAKQQDVIEALVIRFDRVPEGLREEIEHIGDVEKLSRLLRTAIRCVDMEDFAKEL